MEELESVPAASNVPPLFVEVEPVVSVLPALPFVPVEVPAAVEVPSALVLPDVWPPVFVVESVEAPLEFVFCDVDEVPVLVPSDV